MSITRATLGRLPMYLDYLKTCDETYVSAAMIARDLELGEVQVRKDLASISDSGRPKIGFSREKLIAELGTILGGKKSKAVVIGAGRLGRALLEFDGFLDFGVEVVAAFDTSDDRLGITPKGKSVLSMKGLSEFCSGRDIRIAIVTVPKQAAQEVCDALIACGIRVIWNFTTVNLTIPDGVLVKNENLALSLAHLKIMADYENE